MTQFKDLFSKQASDYSKYRPKYPPALFEHLASLCPGKNLAWDCGTGNGQAAVELARHFDQVIATDPSEKQLSQAVKNPRITYRVASAEASGLPDGSVDLVTVAQALHWFKFDAFYSEVRQVCKNSGARLAVWTYEMARITPEIDAEVDRYYHKIVGTYWEPERRLVETAYSTIPFPFQELPAPRFEMHETWNLAHLIGYLGTWSATQAAAKALSKNPVDEIAPAISHAWGDPMRERAVSWLLHLKTGKVS